MQHSIEKYIITKIPIAKKSDTVKKVLSLLETTSFDNADYIYVTDNNGKLRGVFSVRELFRRSKNTPVTAFMQTGLITMSPDTDAEKVAHVALKHDLKAVPIVKSKKLIGIISSKEIVAIVNKALREDIFHFAGIHKSHLDFGSSLEIPLLKVIEQRVSWLIVGLFGAMLIAFYMGFFESTLQSHFIIAAFVPAIVYMSGALGTQLQTIFVRDLAVLGKHINLRAYFLRQIGASLSIALIIAAIMFASISLFWKEAFIGFVISSATFLTLLITSVTAFLITLAIERFRFDPALGSGPVATIISDITSVIIYFLVVIWLL